VFGARGDLGHGWDVEASLSTARDDGELRNVDVALRRSARHRGLADSVRRHAVRDHRRAAARIHAPPAGRAVPPRSPAPPRPRRRAGSRAPPAPSSARCRSVRPNARGCAACRAASWGSWLRLLWAVGPVPFLSVRRRGLEAWNYLLCRAGLVRSESARRPTDASRITEYTSLRFRNRYRKAEEG